jgi:hypothetical protein
VNTARRRRGDKAILIEGTLDAKRSNVTTAVREPGTPPVLAHSKVGRSLLMAIAISYVIDG